MTVNSLDITDNFTVAGGTPVTGEDLQKVQDQIIAPEQTIYVSSDGSDETGYGTRDNPYKTIDKASENIKEGVPSIIIRIIDKTGTVPFYISKCIRPKTGNTSLTIQANNRDININQNKHIQIYVNPSYYYDYTQSGKTWNVYGYFIAWDWTDITINGLDIYPPVDITSPPPPYNPATDKYNRQLFNCNNLNIFYSNITLNNNCLWYPKTLNCFLRNSNSTVTQKSDFYIISAYFNRYTEEDETIHNISGTFGSITSIVNSEGGSFKGNVDKLLTDNCHCIYKNF